MGSHHSWGETRTGLRKQAKYNLHCSEKKKIGGKKKSNRGGPHKGGEVAEKTGSRAQGPVKKTACALTHFGPARGGETHGPKKNQLPP